MQAVRQAVLDLTVEVIAVSTSAVSNCLQVRWAPASTVATASHMQTAAAAEQPGLHSAGQVTAAAYVGGCS